MQLSWPQCLRLLSAWCVSSITRLHLIYIQPTREYAFGGCACKSGMFYKLNKLLGKHGQLALMSVERVLFFSIRINQSVKDAFARLVRGRGRFAVYLSPSFLYLSRQQQDAWTDIIIKSTFYKYVEHNCFFGWRAHRE